jgi:hypothetical protein
MESVRRAFDSNIHVHPIQLIRHSTELRELYQLDLRHPGAADQRIGLEAVLVRGGVVFCMGCLTCGEWESAIRIGVAAADCLGRWIRWMGVFLSGSAWGRWRHGVP